MTHHFLNRPSLIVLVLTGLLVSIGYFQHHALGKASNEAGTIEGILVDALLATDTAVVFIKEVPGESPMPIENGSMSQKKLTFNPKILPVVVGTKVLCPNDDNVTHNIFSPSKSAKSFNFGLYPPGSNKEIVVEKAGVVPFRCNIHADMAAYVVVCPNRYFAKTDNDGKFKIENVPPGQYKLTFWHEKLRPKTVEVKVTSGATATAKFSNLERGKFSIDILK